MIPFDKSWADCLREWLASLAPVVLTALAFLLIAILAWGAWAVSTQPIRLHYLGVIALAVVGLLGLALQGQKLDGLKLKAGKDGVELEADMEIKP